MPRRMKSEVLNYKRFKNSFTPASYEVRNLIDDGLFTAMRFYIGLKLSLTDNVL